MQIDVKEYKVYTLDGQSSHEHRPEWQDDVHARLHGPWR